MTDSPFRCTMCGKTLDEWDMQQPFGFDHVIGYGSVHDLERIRFRLCCGCFDKAMDRFIPLCKENPVIEEDVGFLDTADKTMIENERSYSARHLIATVGYRGVLLAELTKENVGKVEAMITTDSDYRRSSDPTAAPGYNRNGKLVYPGSSAYWLTRSDREFSFKNVLEAVSAIDRENSTHLNADGVGRGEMAARLMAVGQADLKRMLKARDFGVYDLLVAPTHPSDPAHRARENVSFAAKFCHYACFCWFAGTVEQDNFSIWDNEVKDILPLYLKSWNLPVPKDLRDYRQYSDAIDTLRKRTGNLISRNGFDHLLWYFHKG